MSDIAKKIGKGVGSDFYDAWITHAYPSPAKKMGDFVTFPPLLLPAFGAGRGSIFVFRVKRGKKATLEKDKKKSRGDGASLAQIVLFFPRISTARPVLTPKFRTKKFFFPVQPIL